MIKNKLKNKVIIYWDNPSYLAVDVSEIKKLPKEVQIMIANTILRGFDGELSIEVRSY